MCAQVRELREAREGDKITQLITQLVSDLAESPVSNVRKGALHALAGTAIGLRQDVSSRLHQLLPPVLSSFSDQDPRVRYYGCEALYNIAKVARAGCVPHFNSIFDGLFKLSADTDTQARAPRARTRGPAQLSLQVLGAPYSVPIPPPSSSLALRCRTACSCSIG